MDNFSKQKVNERLYKEMRDKPSEEYKGDYNSPHYYEVPNGAIKATSTVSKETYSSDYKEDFDKASRDYWQKNTQEGLQKYNGGSVAANFGKDVYTVEELLNRIGNLIKESISNELKDKKIPTEGLSENFKALEVSLQLLSNSVKSLDEKTDITNMTAYLHGFINTFVTDTLSKKIERENEREK